MYNDVLLRMPIISKRLRIIHFDLTCYTFEVYNEVGSSVFNTFTNYRYKMWESRLYRDF